jgi:hypothetical protein
MDALFAWIVVLETLQIVTSTDAIVRLLFSVDCCDNSFLVGFYGLNLSHAIIPLAHLLFSILYTWTVFQGLVFLITIAVTSTLTSGHLGSVHFMLLNHCSNFLIV